MENLTLKEFSELAASSKPTPGGGGVSALVSSLAASLAEMVTNLTIGKKKYLEFTDELNTLKLEAEKLRVELLNCIKKDEEAFLPLSKAYSMDKSLPEYETIMETCLNDAASVPMMILKYSTKIIELDERLAIIGSKLAISDVANSASLAYGALYGGYINVLVNTHLMKNKEIAASIENEANSLLEEYSKRAMLCFENVLKRLG